MRILACQCEFCKRQRSLHVHLIDKDNRLSVICEECLIVLFPDLEVVTGCDVFMEGQEC